LSKKAKYVMKFGGSSLSSGENINRCVSLIVQYLIEKESSLVVVCSAVGDTTDDLLKAVDLAKHSDFNKAKEVLAKVKKIHEAIVRESISNPSLSLESQNFLEDQIAKLERTLYGIFLLKDASPRTLDFVLSFGEQLSTKIVSYALASKGIRTKYLTGGEAGIVTNDQFGSAEPIMSKTEDNLRKILCPILEQGIVPVVTGFIAESDEERNVTTLGRGGSDYTASLIASAIQADEVLLWTDVDGILTADPRIVREARIVDQITYLEAMEMSAFGAKSMQPRALEPVALKEIPVCIKNAFNPKSKGTLISSPRKVQNGSYFGIKSIGSVSDVAIVSLSGASIAGYPGTALKIFEILKELDVSLLMISQAVSESNVSLAIKKKDLSKVIRTLKQELLHEDSEQGLERDNGEDSSFPYSNLDKKKTTANSVFAKIECEDDVAIIAVLGRGMIGTPGIAGRVFTTVASEGINIRMIAQGSSEINISFVIKEKDRIKAMIALHNEFCLGKENTHHEQVEKKKGEPAAPKLIN
jgi:aspartate kinase